MRRPQSLRLQMAILVGGFSFAVLAVAGAAIVWTVDQRMHDTIRNEALRALDSARISLQAGVARDVIAAPHPGDPTIQFFPNATAEEADPGPLGENLPPVTGDDELVLTPFDGELLAVEPGQTTVVKTDVAGAPAYVALSSEADGDGRYYTVAASAPLAQTERTISTLRTATIIAVPGIALALAGLAALLLTGRALRPVDAMRAQARAISQGTLHRRLTPTARSAELAALADTMNEMLDRLDEAATTQRKFTADASHELRSPLTTIRGIVELAITDAETIQQTGPTAIAEIDRLDSLVADLLTLARLDERTPFELTDIDLDDLVTAQIATLEPQHLAIDATGLEHARIRADQKTLTSLVRNLLDNAARHAKTTITVAVEANDDNVELIVDDDGPGVPADQRDTIFNRFARLEDSRSRNTGRPGGTGLGLAVAAAAARAHDGTIEVGDAPIGGARFRVTIPATPHRDTSRQGGDCPEPG